MPSEPGSTQGQGRKNINRGTTTEVVLQKLFVHAHNLFLQEGHANDSAEEGWRYQELFFSFLP
jgi:hypothetical protein